MLSHYVVPLLAHVFNRLEEKERRKRSPLFFLEVSTMPQHSEEQKDQSVNVQVAVRCRPSNAEEKKSGVPVVISTNQEKKSVDVSYGASTKKQSKTYSFDKVFGAYSTQEEVFEALVSPIIQECLAGYNSTIFCYGQTGTGKTHTMEGDIHHEELAGIVPRSIRAIFETLTNGGAEFTVRVSFLELYNEELQDLLTVGGANENKKLKLMEVEKKGVIVQNLEEVTVLSSNDIFEILARGIQQRATAATNMNKNSSRSHSIFTMKIMIKECNVDGEEVVRHGQLNLVDLAGSECVGRSGAKNDRAREAGNINQSLLTLGRVITALVDHHGHVPYRDSKLTRLLQESLGGKAKTCIIATLSPSQLAVEETMNTLDYAHKAKNIKNQPLVNQKMTKKTVLKEYCEEIEMLRAQLQLTREKNGVWVEPEKFYAMEQRIASQETQISEVEGVLKSKQDDFKVVKQEKEEAEARVEGLLSDLGSCRASLEELQKCLLIKEEKLAEAEYENTVRGKIIGEQVIAETKLLDEGSSLQKEMIYQRSARDQLLTKIDTLVERESRRMNDTNDFVKSVLDSDSGLCDVVDGIVSASEESSSVLCSGVSTMLTKGKETCADLTVCIDKALCELLQSTSSVTCSMTDNCENLHTHLDSTNNRLAATLTDLKVQLSSWLEEVDTNMKTAVALSAEQTALNEIATAKLGGCKEQIEVLSVGAHEAEAQRVSEYNEVRGSLTKSIIEAFDMYQKQLSAATIKSNESLASQAQQIKSSIGEALAKMLGEARAVNDCIVEDASKFSTSAQDIISTKLSNIAEVSATRAKKQMSTLDNIIEASTSQIQSTSNSLSTIRAKRKELELIVEGVSGAVASKKAKLDDTTSSLLSEVDTDILSAKKAVGATSMAAKKLFEDMEKASNAMNVTTSDSIRVFSSFMDSHGQEVYAGVESHFGALSSSLDDTRGRINYTKSSSKAFHTSLVSDVYENTGNTPQKMSYKEMTELHTLACRPHEVIRASETKKVPVEEIDMDVETETRTEIKNETEEIGTKAEIESVVTLETVRIIGEGHSENVLEQDKGQTAVLTNMAAEPSPKKSTDKSSRNTSKSNREFEGEENVDNVDTSSRSRSRSRSTTSKSLSGLRQPSATRSSSRAR